MLPLRCQTSFRQVHRESISGKADGSTDEVASNAWNFDFDDNESDGADVAAFEFADSAKGGDVADLDDLPHEINPESSEVDPRITSKIPTVHARGRHLSDDNERKPMLHSDRMGFDDFDDEQDDDVDSNAGRSSDVPKRKFSEIESSGSEEFDGCEYDDLANHPEMKSSHVAESWNKSGRRSRNPSVSDDDIQLDSDYDAGDDDDDMNSNFGYRQRNILQQIFGRKGISRRGIDSDAQDELLLDSDSNADDGISYSSRNETRGNKGLSDRRGSNFRSSNNFGCARRGEFRSDGRKTTSRRNSFGDENDGFSFRGSSRNGYSGGREYNRFEHFNTFGEGSRRQDRYKGSKGE